MKKLNLKLKTSLKSVIENEEKSSGASKKDPRYLNYFDMKEGQRMEVLFLPCASGESSWTTDHVHGPRAKVGQQRVRGVAPIACSRMQLGEKCVICDEMFAHYQAGDKEAGNRLQVTERTTAQVLVIKSDIEVLYPEDGNIVKLFNVPDSIVKKVKQAIMEEQVDEDELHLTPFVIKVTKNGEYNQYDTSFFKRNNVTDEEFDELLDGAVVNQYDFSNGEFQTTPASPDEQQTWLKEVTQKINAALGGGSSTGSSARAEAPVKPSRSALAEREDEDEEEFDEDVPDSVTNDGDETPPAKNNISALRNRLKGK